MSKLCIHFVMSRLTNLEVKASVKIFRGQLEDTVTIYPRFTDFYDRMNYGGQLLNVWLLRQRLLKLMFVVVKLTIAVDMLDIHSH